MKKITDFIVEKRYMILTIFIVLVVISVFLMQKVNINYEMANYLPETSVTKNGMNIMEDNFKSTNTSTLNVLFSNLKQDEVEKIKEELSNIEGVKNVAHNSTESYEKDGYFLFAITVDDESDSKTATNVFKVVEDTYKDYDIETSGDIATHNTSVLPSWILILAITSALIILIIMCSSYVEPFLFLFVLGLAVFLNKGTNIMFASVSNVTDSIVAILQMALSMDYSIMLMNRYSEEKLKEKDKVKAMKNALHKAFIAISSSSVTTIVGLISLVFMSFTFGKDLGFVLAKGVLFSLICIFFCLPGLILIFDKWITKTKKKSPNFNLSWLGKYSYKIRYISFILLIVIFVGSFLLKGNLNIAFTCEDDNIINQVFKANNQIAVIYNNDDEDKITNICENINKLDKVTESLCYGNTINEKIRYDELNAKLESLNTSTSITEDIIKLLYYDYYNKSEIKLTYQEFLTFLEELILDNSNFKKYFSEDTQKKLDLLAYFVDSNSLNEKRSINELAAIFPLDENYIKNLLTLYNSNTNEKLSINEFLTFVLNEKSIKDSLDQSTLNNFTFIARFTDSKKLNKQMDIEEISNYFGMDSNLIKKNYIYYILKNDVSNTLSIQEFSLFILSNLISNQEFSNYFDNDVVTNINILNTFSNKELINTKFDYEKLSILFNLDAETVKNILYLYNQNNPSTSSYTLKEFVLYITYIKNNTNYLNDFDVSAITNLYDFANNTNNINNTKLSKDDLSTLFDATLVSNAYNALSIENDAEFTPQEFVNLVIDNFSTTLDVSNMLILKSIMESDSTTYDVESLSLTLNIPDSTINSLYNVITLVNNPKDWELSPFEFSQFLLENNLSSSEDLIFLYNVMQSANAKVKYIYQDLAVFINLDPVLVKTIYAYYEVSHNEVLISPIDLIEFLSNNQDDFTISSYLDNTTITNLTMIHKIMLSSINDIKYSTNELANIFNTDIDSISLIYGLYITNNNPVISLKEFVPFLNTISQNYQIDEETKSLLTVLLNIINDVEAFNALTSKQLYANINLLDLSIKESTINLLYTYYGSYYLYNDNYELTAEEIVKYLNTSFLNDSKYSDFIDTSMKKEIVKSQESIDDAHNLLVGKKYSRMVINTTYELENEETFEFIQKLQDDLKENDIEAYVIGDSPMAYEMDQIFPSELNYITILTMLFIFIVVALTFKSLIIPLILVLLIQTAVFLIMGILSFFGGAVYFIALLIVQSILMGATIDYAILYTSYYLENRKELNKKESLINAYNRSIHTILTSSSILMIVTFLVGILSSGVTSRICLTIAEGTFCSVMLILLLLPAVLSCIDCFIVKKKK